MKLKPLPLFLLATLIALLPLSTAHAQDSELKLGLSRDFGYGGMGDDIQGLFSMKIADPPADLVKVVFMIDGEIVNEDSEAPFKFQFSTDSYPLGMHTLSASGITSSGSELTSNEIRVEFVSAEEGGKVALKIVAPVLILVFGVMLLGLAGPYLMGGGKLSHLPLGEPRDYGLRGGAICPKCKRPFRVRLLAFNLGFHKLDRCPYCGKWGLQRLRSLDQLRAAEAAELEMAQPGEAASQPSEADKLRKDLDDSRFQDS